MLIKFHEQEVNNFLIPSFTLSKGEIVIVQFPNDPFFHSLAMSMVEILEGKTNNDRIESLSPLKYVEHFRESELRRRFYPTTIGEYLRKNANRNNPVHKKIYDIEWMKPTIQMKTLAGSLRRQITLYTTLSWTNCIIFDFVGVDPQGGQDIYKYLKTIAETGGAVLLFDYCDEFKNECTTFIQSKYIGEEL